MRRVLCRPLFQQTDVARSVKPAFVELAMALIGCHLEPTEMRRHPIDDLGLICQLLHQPPHVGCQDFDGGINRPVVRPVVAFHVDALVAFDR